MASFSLSKIFGFRTNESPVGHYTRKDIEDRLNVYCTKEPLTDETFLQIASLLDHLDRLRGDDHKCVWKRSPRTFAILYLLESTDFFPIFAEHNTDFDLPYDFHTWPTGVKHRDLQDMFLAKQDKVLTPAYNLEMGTRSHLHLSVPGDTYFGSMHTLGKGGFGRVDQVFSRLSYCEYARKIVSRGNGPDKKAKHKAIVEELELLKKLSHRHVVSYIGLYTDKEYIAYLMKPIADCDLQKFLLRPEATRVDGDSRLKIADFYGCLAGAINYVHNQRIRHADITSRNILVKGNCIYLSDFGAARDFSATGKSTTQSNVPFDINYVAPEVARQEPRNSKSDMWSLGVVFLEMTTVLQARKLTRFWKYMEKNARNKHHAKSVQANLPTANSWLDKIRSSYEGDSLYNEPIAWIKALLEEDPKNRPSSKQLMTLIHSTPSFQNFCCLKCQEEFDEGDFEYADELEQKTPKARKERSGTDELRASAAAMLVSKSDERNLITEAKIAGITRWMGFTHDKPEVYFTTSPLLSQPMTASPMESGTESSSTSGSSTLQQSDEVESDSSNNSESSDRPSSFRGNHLVDSGRGYMIKTERDSSDEEDEHIERSIPSPWYDIVDESNSGSDSGAESDDTQFFSCSDQDQSPMYPHSPSDSLSFTENHELQLGADDQKEDMDRSTTESFKKPA